MAVITLVMGRTCCDQRCDGDRWPSTSNATILSVELKLEHCARWIPAGQEAQDGYADLLQALRDRSTLPVSLRK